MCGFAGFVDRNENKQAILKAMLQTIVHRGPDSEGTYIDEDAALGFRRLSIIDLADGSQPLYNEDRSLVLLFNGEIYNYQGLREELIADGHVFTTHTDSEVLIHGYEKYGEQLLDKLRGMFAFCIWDVKKKKLFIARDFFGIKPMYYAKMGDTFLFGSETKAFLEHPGFHKELNEEMLEHYLSFQFVPGSSTFFKDVYALPPAHFLTYENGKVEVKRYWQPEFESFGFIKSKAVREYAERLIEQYDVRSGQGPVTITRSMSGGNQQKAIIAREIDKDPDLLVAVQPTRGLDVGAIEYIHSQLVAQRDKGKAVLLVSLELDEVMDVSDRILVMYEGELVGQLDPKTVSVEELGLYMAGAKRDPVPEEV